MPTTKESKAQPAAEQPKLPTDPNPKLGQVIRLAQGPDRGVPVFDEFTLEDGSKAQRYQSPKGSVVIRRTHPPEERYRLKFMTWWEVEIG